MICETLECTEGLSPYEPLTEFKIVYQGNVKLVSDRSNPGLAGYLSEPYNCEPTNNIGYFNFPYQSTPDQVTPLFKQIVKTIAGKGWPLMIHANGNKAIDFTLEAYKAALAGIAG